MFLDGEQFLFICARKVDTEGETETGREGTYPSQTCASIIFLTTNSETEPIKKTLDKSTYIIR
jgi:hypothetical protein